MNAHEYLQALQRKNPKVFAAKAEKIAITISSFEEQIVAAFKSGIEEGKSRAENDKSLFEKIFG